MLIILLIAVGPSQLPKLSRSMGSGIREVKDAVTFGSSDEPRRADRPAAPAPPPPPPPTAAVPDDADRRA